MKLGNILASTAAAGLLLGTAVACGGNAAPAAAPEPGAAAGAKDCCKGLNECKGKGGCAGDSHDCAGKNECKAAGGCNAHCPK